MYDNSYQPYGQTAAPAPMRKTEYLSLRRFGIAYMVIRGLLLGALLLLLMLGASLLTTSELGSEAGAIMGVIIVFFLVWLGFVVAAGVMSMKNMIAGVYMGLADAGVTTLLWMVALFSEGNFNPCLLGANILIIIMGVNAMREYYGQDSTPGYAPPQPYAGPQAYGAPVQQPVPQPAPVAQPPVQTGTASIPSPKAAALGVLQLAASLDRDHAQEGLQRARRMGLQLLGPAAKARVARQLQTTTQVMDIDHDLWRYTSILASQPNETMKRNVVKAAQFVLTSPHGEIPMNEQFIATLKHQLGV